MSELNPSESIMEDNFDELIPHTQHIIDTHFHTFNWLDVKMQGLLAIAAASLAAATFVIKNLHNINFYEITFIVLASILLIIGMVISLLHLMPIMDAGVGNITNPRVAAGIAKIDKEDYHSLVSNLKKGDMVKYNCYQISGLARICILGQRRLRNAIIFIASGLIVIAATVSLWGLRSIVNDDLPNQNSSQHMSGNITTCANKSLHKTRDDLTNRKRSKRNASDNINSNSKND